MRIRQAQYRDIPEIMTVITAAKGIMRSSGNVNQWIGGYPSEEIIAARIASLPEVHGISYCGIIYLESGDERLAYQKILK